MNYIELINRFWALHEEQNFSTTEVALFFYLLRVNNQCSWRPSFRHNNKVVEGQLRISYNTLKGARDRLQVARAICYHSENGNANVTYAITLSNFDEGTSEDWLRFCRGLIGVDIEVSSSKDKLNETKPNSSHTPPAAEPLKVLDKKIISLPGAAGGFHLGSEMLPGAAIDYYRKQAQTTFEAQMMSIGTGLTIAEVEQRHRSDYPAGYAFREFSHMINSVRAVIEKLQREKITTKTTHNNGLKSQPKGAIVKTPGAAGYGRL